jgi:hypothetical protein
MSLRTFLPFLVLLGGALAAPAHAQERVPAPRIQPRGQLDPELRERIRQHVQERLELRRELQEKLLDHRRQLLDRIAERMRHHDAWRGRIEPRERRGHRWDGWQGRREFWRERMHSRRSV